jgi:voltage-gated potassium channel
VVSPYQISGARMASLALRPAVLEFVDMLSVAPDLRIEELVVGDGSRMADKTVKQACSPYGGVMLLAVKRRDGELLFPPVADTVLCRGDLVIAAGRADALAGLADDAR